MSLNETSLTQMTEQEILDFITSLRERRTQVREKRIETKRKESEDTSLKGMLSNILTGDEK